MEILDVDLTGFERGDGARRRAVVDGVRRSLETGFVYVRHDLDEDELEACYAALATFFALPADVKARTAAPGSRGQRGYTGLLVEVAAGRTTADWKEHSRISHSSPAKCTAASKNQSTHFAGPPLLSAAATTRAAADVSGAVCPCSSCSTSSAHAVPSCHG